MFAKLEAKRPVSRKVEEFLRQYGITGFACNAFVDTLLLAAGITEQVKSLGAGFLEPDDYARMYIRLESVAITQVEKFFKFVQQHDTTAILEKKEADTYKIYMNCATCLKKIVPLFEQAFLERIQPQPNCLEVYQEVSASYYAEYLKKISAETQVNAIQSTTTSLRAKSMFMFPITNSQGNVQKNASASNDNQEGLNPS